MKQLWSARRYCQLETRATILKFLRFLAAGVPGLLIAIPLNLLLVEILGLRKPIAYAVVLLVQVSVNFFFCLLFVFDRDKSRSLVTQYLGFLAVVGVARGMDWGLYVVLTSLVGLPYILVQLMNAFIFGVGKFVLTRRVIEQPRHRGSSPSRAAERKGRGEPESRCSETDDKQPVDLLCKATGVPGRRGDLTGDD